MNKYVALIPARGGSKSIPLKNIKKIAGKPLIFWAIEAALECSIINKIYLSTDSDEISSVAEQINDECFEVIERSPETATDIASTESVMLEFSKNHDFENIILIQATSPLITSDDLNNAIDIYEQKKADSLLSVVNQTRFIWEKCSEDFIQPLNYDPTKRPRRQEFDGYLVENGAFYITSHRALVKTKSRISGNIAYYKMDEDSYFEIDEPSDWLIVEQLLMMHKKSIQPLKDSFARIKMLITDVDGVLTDCGMYYSEKIDELKKFNTRDGMGMQLLRECGIKVAIITKESTKIVEARARKLNVTDLFQGVDDKLAVVDDLKAKYGLDYSEIAYIGDDVNDLQVLEKVGLSVCPNDAVDDVTRICDIVLTKKGGEGAVREFYEQMMSCSVVK
ncbi:MAG: HAD hydrolase family protein [Euryarchaeota archaeon]|nr:HAD hydrolase family protein [Euryarchaeota archaeon]